MLSAAASRRSLPPDRHVPRPSSPASSSTRPRADLLFLAPARVLVRRGRLSSRASGTSGGRGRCLHRRSWPGGPQRCYPTKSVLLLGPLSVEAELMERSRPNASRAARAGTRWRGAADHRAREGQRSRYVASLFLIHPSYPGEKKRSREHDRTPPWRARKLTARASLPSRPPAGSHILSGAVIETRALDELLPDWKSLGAPVSFPPSSSSPSAPASELNLGALLSRIVHRSTSSPPPRPCATSSPRPPSQSLTRPR